MKPFRFSTGGAPGYGSVLEKIEILRTQLRLAQRLEREDIVPLLQQCNELRGEVLGLSRASRINDTEPARPPAPVKPKAAARRQALVDRDFVFEGVFGDNPKLLEALEVAEKAAPTELPVLIYGESGTGKELVAKVVHVNGGRSDQPFISINCGAIPENLLESELFGHKKGAFTGADAERKGRFESADGGTLFLDEVGELPLSGQVKLLRALQSQEIQRVGSDRAIRVDVRIVAATNRDLLEMVRKGAFREDLYYRLCVIEVTLPPLRERRDEIALLIDFFGAEAAEKLHRAPLELSPELQRALLSYDFPGNIRELRNLIYRMSCLAGDTADLTHLPASVKPSAASLPLADINPDTSLADAKKTASNAAEKQFLEQGLKDTNGRVVDLARRVGMNRSHLQTLMKKHGFSAKDFRRPK